MSLTFRAASGFVGAMSKLKSLTVLCASALMLGLAHAQPAAKPFTPSNPPEMKPLADRNSPAHQAAKLFLHGANLGNYLEVPRGQDWGVTVSAEEFRPLLDRILNSRHFASAGRKRKFRSVT